MNFEFLPYMQTHQNNYMNRNYYDKRWNNQHINDVQVKVEQINKWEPFIITLCVAICFLIISVCINLYNEQLILSNESNNNISTKHKHWSIESVVCKTLSGALSSSAGIILLSIVISLLMPVTVKTAVKHIKNNSI
jgi:hypothetical protein